MFEVNSQGQNVKEIKSCPPPKRKGKEKRKKGVLCKILCFHGDCSLTSWAVIHKKIELELNGPQRTVYQLYCCMSIHPRRIYYIERIPFFGMDGWMNEWMNEWITVTISRFVDNLDALCKRVRAFLNALCWIDCCWLREFSLPH